MSSALVTVGNVTSNVINAVTLSGTGTNVIVNGAVADTLTISAGAGLKLVGNLLNAATVTSTGTEQIHMGVTGGSVLLSGISHAITTSAVAGATVLTDTAGVISFTGTVTTSGAALATAIMSVLMADVAATTGVASVSQNSIYTTGAGATGATYLFHTDIVAGAVTGEWVQLTGVATGVGTGAGLVHLV